MRGLDMACINSHLNLAQWLLYTINQNNILITPINYANLFYSACESGNIEITKWVYEIIQPSNEVVINALKFACEINHLDIICWLYQMQPINHEILDYLYTIALQNDDSTIETWLLNIKPTLKKNIPQNKFPYQLLLCYSVKNKKYNLHDNLVHNICMFFF
jgi:hypothetical protein